MAEVPPFLWADAGDFDSPVVYSVPGSGEVQPYTATATYSNGSGQAILPALRIKSDSGNLLALTFPVDQTIANGDAQEVTFVPPFGSAQGSSSAATAFPRATFSGIGQVTNGPVNVRQTWGAISTPDPTVFEIDATDPTKANLLTAGTFLFLGWYGFNSAIGHTLTANATAFLDTASGGNIQVSNWPTNGETNTFYPSIGGGHGAISGMYTAFGPDSVRVSWTVRGTDQAFVELHTIMYVVRLG